MSDQSDPFTESAQSVDSASCSSFLPSLHALLDLVRIPSSLRRCLGQVLQPVSRKDLSDFSFHLPLTSLNYIFIFYETCGWDLKIIDTSGGNEFSPEGVWPCHYKCGEEGIRVEQPTEVVHPIRTPPGWGVPVLVGGSPAADAGHSGEIASLGWPGNASLFPRVRWRRWLTEGALGFSG